MPGLAGIALLILATAFPAFAQEQALTDEEREQARVHIERDRPQMVTVEAVEFSGRTVTIRGSSTNVNAAANFVENIKVDPLFTRPVVAYLRMRTEEPTKVYEFEFSTSVREPEDSD